jgi:hypothetical protein
VRGSKMRSRYKRETIYAFRHTYVTHCELNPEIRKIWLMKIFSVLPSVADPGMFIPDPGFIHPEYKKEKEKK